LRLALSLVIVTSVPFNLAINHLSRWITGTQRFSPAEVSSVYADVRQDDLVGGTSLAENWIEDAPSVIAPCALVASADGTILWERGGFTTVPIASTTKIMTAVIALERADIEMECLVTAGAASTDGTSAWIQQGDRIRLYDLLLGLMIPSGNDAAVAIAENIAGNVFAFVDMMNAKAAELGMFNTHYVDPNGLNEDGLYSTVRDYLILARYAMRNETFREIVKLQQAKIWTLDGREIEFFSTNKLLYVEDLNRYFGIEEGNHIEILGIKTGTHFEADACLVSCVRYNGIAFYSVVFGAPLDQDRYSDTVSIMKWAFRHYRQIELINSTVLVADLALTSWEDKTVPVRAPYPVSVEVFNLFGPITQEVELNDWEGSITKGEKVGRIIWTQNGEVIATSDLVATEAVDEPSFWERVAISWNRFTSGFSGQPKHADTRIYLPGVFEIPF
jgi:D-alanyl-D-alanine carboxypeptidase (penicillin-binding protein 5/6)